MNESGKKVANSSEYQNNELLETEDIKNSDEVEDLLEGENLLDDSDIKKYIKDEDSTSNEIKELHLEFDTKVLRDSLEFLFNLIPKNSEPDKRIQVKADKEKGLVCFRFAGNGDIYGEIRVPTINDEYFKVLERSFIVDFNLFTNVLKNTTSKSLIFLEDKDGMKLKFDSGYEIAIKKFFVDTTAYDNLFADFKKLRENNDSITKIKIDKLKNSISKISRVMGLLSTDHVHIDDKTCSSANMELCHFKILNPALKNVNISKLNVKFIGRLLRTISKIDIKAKELNFSKTKYNGEEMLFFDTDYYSILVPNVYHDLIDVKTTNELFESKLKYKAGLSFGYVYELLSLYNILINWSIIYFQAENKELFLSSHKDAEESFKHKIGNFQEEVELKVPFTVDILKKAFYVFKKADIADFYFNENKDIVFIDKEDKIKVLVESKLAKS